MQSQTFGPSISKDAVPTTGEIREGVGKQVSELEKNISGVSRSQHPFGTIKASGVSAPNVDFPGMPDVSAPGMPDVSAPNIPNPLDYMPGMPPTPPNPLDYMPTGIPNVPNPLDHMPSGVPNVPNPLDYMPSGVPNVPNPLDYMPSGMPNVPNPLDHMPSSVPNPLDVLKGMSNPLKGFNPLDHMPGMPPTPGNPLDVLKGMSMPGNPLESMGNPFSGFEVPDVGNPLNVLKGMSNPLKDMGNPFSGFEVPDVGNPLNVLKGMSMPGNPLKHLGNPFSGFNVPSINIPDNNIWKMLTEAMPSPEEAGTWMGEKSQDLVDWFMHPDNQKMMGEMLIKSTAKDQGPLGIGGSAQTDALNALRQKAMTDKFKNWNNPSGGRGPELSGEEVVDAIKAGSGAGGKGGFYTDPLSLMNLAGDIIGTGNPITKLITKLSGEPGAASGNIPAHWSTPEELAQRARDEKARAEFEALSEEEKRKIRAENWKIRTRPRRVRHVRGTRREPKPEVEVSPYEKTSMHKRSGDSKAAANSISRGGFTATRAGREWLNRHRADDGSGSFSFTDLDKRFSDPAFLALLNEQSGSKTGLTEKMQNPLIQALLNQMRLAETEAEWTPEKIALHDARDDEDWI
jgi:hypothetical protein